MSCLLVVSVNLEARELVRFIHFESRFAILGALSFVVPLSSQYLLAIVISF